MVVQSTCVDFKLKSGKVNRAEFDYAFRAVHSYVYNLNDKEFKEFNNYFRKKFFDEFIKPQTKNGSILWNNAEKIAFNIIIEFISKDI